MTKHRRVSTTLYVDEERIVADIKKTGWAHCDSGAIRHALHFYDRHKGQVGLE